jgi:hypothetical protein
MPVFLDTRDVVRGKIKSKIICEEAQVVLRRRIKTYNCEVPRSILCFRFAISIRVMEA